ncbi:hypothetical protein I7I53_07607 [Histoplasma capsulatum var. duboisii H88]|uniref:Uncharacterized protein n=1 Tax=Ajellomyces capsulatus (strain H88) TaxID=544711 RepID=A0A8A1LDF8_AJEC8|nr:hypothetical protein I7I53_07607 [Histoplasma capsulatum var. duboisii H88]
MTSIKSLGFDIAKGKRIRRWLGLVDSHVAVRYSTDGCSFETAGRTWKPQSAFCCSDSNVMKVFGMKILQKMPLAGHVLG